MILKKYLIQLYYSIIYYIPGLIREILFHLTEKNSIVLTGFLDFKWGKWHKSNWGDDLNVYFAQNLFSKKIINYETSILSWLFHRTNYTMIGSMLHAANRHTIVWGTGMLAEDMYPKEVPQKILAVRGKLTREALIKQGYDCPEVYGDPALLLPYFYQPSKEKKYRVGIVPHMYDEDNPIIHEWLAKNSDCYLISMKNYTNKFEIVDKIVSCELIISSSLHGIIVSDAYHIPNVWVEFSDKVIGNGFKFRDYFSSVNKSVQEPKIIKDLADLDNTSNLKEHFFSIKIDLKKLIESCPFKINIKSATIK